jgi:hypothetical protein
LLISSLRSLGVDWYVFGAQAALVYGAARVTADIDVTVRLGKITPLRLAAALKSRGFALRVADLVSQWECLRAQPEKAQRRRKPAARRRKPARRSR